MFSSQGLNGLPALGDIVNLGKLIWEVIQYNRPAANLSSDFANAVPRGTESWKDLSGWSSPQAQTFTVTYKNKFRAKVVDFKYQLLYTHSGSMKGQGKYLANITVIPAKINVLAGFKLNASATVPQVTNMGTEELPVAAAQVLVKWRVETLLQHQQVAKVYSLTGAGEYKDITHP
ncbi:MAG: hypothetical protein IT289_02350 [Oligoflexia bacterium]|nr:hypothetical protein [Oligoflexia bacterium]